MPDDQLAHHEVPAEPVSFNGRILISYSRTLISYIENWFYNKNRLGGHSFTTVSNCISFGSQVWFATIPLLFTTSRYNWWPMFAGLFLGCASWSANVYVRAQGSAHAFACGIGNGEYSSMLANLRSVVATLAPMMYGAIYTW